MMGARAASGPGLNTATLAQRSTGGAVLALPQQGTRVAPAAKPAIEPVSPEAYDLVVAELGPLDAEIWNRLTPDARQRLAEAAELFRQRVFDVDLETELAMVAARRQVRSLQSTERQQRTWDLQLRETVEVELGPSGVEDWERRTEAARTDLFAQAMIRRVSLASDPTVAAEREQGATSNAYLQTALSVWMGHDAVTVTRDTLNGLMDRRAAYGSWFTFAYTRLSGPLEQGVASQEGAHRERLYAELSEADDWHQLDHVTQAERLFVADLGEAARRALAHYPTPTPSR